MLSDRNSPQREPEKEILSFPREWLSMFDSTASAVLAHIHPGEELAVEAIIDLEKDDLQAQTYAVEVLKVKLTRTHFKTL